MLARKAIQRVGTCSVFLVLASCFGCAVTVQNRYSVFGFDRFLTESAEQARTWSLLLLGGVAIVSAALGITGFWLSQRLYRRWRARPETEPPPLIRNTGLGECEVERKEVAV
jgi:hypothetical protein